MTKHVVIETTANHQWVAFSGRRMRMDDYVVFYGEKAFNLPTTPIFVTREALQILPEAAGQTLRLSRSKDSLPDEKVAEMLLPEMHQAARRRGLVLDEESVELEIETVAGVQLYALKGIGW